MKKLGVIELDTKSVKLVIANYNEQGLFTIIEDSVEPLKIYNDLDSDGIIKPLRIVETINQLRTLKRLAEAYQVEEVIAYAMPLFKTARNNKSFFEEIFTSTGYQFNILENMDIYTVLHYSAINMIEPIKGVIVDVGDRAINLIKYNRKNILDTLTFDFGSLTLANMFSEEADTATRMDKMVQYCQDMFKETTFFENIEEEFKKIGMGSAFVNTAKISRLKTRYTYNNDNNYELTLDNFYVAYNLIKELGADKTKRIKGVSDERADVIASGLAIIKALTQSFGINSFSVCTGNLQLGHIYKEMTQLTGDKQQLDILLSSLQACNLFYDTKENNCNKIYQIANDLFEELHVLHRYTKHHQRILKIASFFAQSGRRISYNNFERNSLYAVLNSDIYGATHKEIVVAAYVAASQNFEEFDFSSWVTHKDIITEDYSDVVRKLSILVKIARLVCKDRNAESIVCDVLGDNCILHVVPKENEPINFEAVKKAIPDFKRAYQKILQIL